MATMRKLPDAHPVNKLLRPHFRYTMAIHTCARTTLINPGGPIDLVFGIGGAGKVELFKRASEIYTVDFTNIKQSIEERGLQSVPMFYYHDDGLKVWGYFESLVTATIDEFYASDSEVRNDEELKKWTEDLYTNAGFLNIRDPCQAEVFLSTLHQRAT